MKIVISLLCLILIGCSAKKIEVKKEYIQRPLLEISKPNPVKINKIKWYIITPENFENVFTELENTKNAIVIFGLTDVGYENLSINLADLQRYIIEQSKIIQAYKDYYESKRENKKEIPKN